MHQRSRVMILVTVLVFSLVALAASGCGSSGPKAAVENFMQAGKDKDCEKMVDLMDLSAFQALGASMSRDELVNSCKSESGLGDVVSYKILDEKTEGDVSTYNVEVTTSDNGTEKTESSPIKVKKINDEWKISLT